MTILNDAAALIDGPRQDTYGDATENFRRIGAAWAAVLGLPEPIPARTVAWMMVSVKAVRDIAGTGDHRDNLVDAVGYLALADREPVPSPEPDPWAPDPDGYGGVLLSVDTDPSDPDVHVMPGPSSKRAFFLTSRQAWDLAFAISKGLADVRAAGVGFMVPARSDGLPYACKVDGEDATVSLTPSGAGVVCVRFDGRASGSGVVLSLGEAANFAAELRRGAGA